MANLFQCDDSIARQLDNYTAAATEQDLNGALAILFTAPTSAVSHATTLGSLTEATFPGYARVTLSSAHWPASSVTSHVASTTYGLTLTWTCSGGGSSQTVYGLAILDSTAGHLLYCANFDSGPYTMVNSGDKISETLTIQQESIF